MLASTSWTFPAQRKRDAALRPYGTMSDMQKGKPLLSIPEHLYDRGATLKLGYPCGAMKIVLTMTVRNTALSVSTSPLTTPNTKSDIY